MMVGGLVRHPVRGACSRPVPGRNGCVDDAYRPESRKYCGTSRRKYHENVTTNI